MGAKDEEKWERKELGRPRSIGPRVCPSGGIFSQAPELGPCREVAPTKGSCFRAQLGERRPAKGSGLDSREAQRMSGISAGSSSRLDRALQEPPALPRGIGLHDVCLDVKCVCPREP